MLSIIAFIGGAAIGGFAVGIPAVLEIRRINSRGWEWYHIAENAVSELNLIKDKRSDATSRGNRTRYAKRRAADPGVLEMGRQRSEERRVGEGGGSTGRSRWGPHNK